ncbi:MAG: omptin family outer membrane protease [Desulfobacca sp.]|nr:omptin family outer membrane protease [Desulfobacca sp.]
MKERYNRLPLFSFVVLLLATAWFTPPALAWEALGPEKKEVVSRERGNIWIALGYLTGDVTYQIGGKYKGISFGEAFQGKVNFPLSELKWPLDLLMFTLGGELRFLKNWELRIAFSKNLTDEPGKDEDSDWEDESRPKVKTCFGTSDTAFSGYILDLGMRYWIIEKQVNRDLAWAIAPGASLLYQEFSWDGSNLVQYDLITGECSREAGPVIAYKFNLLMPFLDLAGRLTYKRLSCLASFAYSPWLIAKDKDFHLLRDRFTKTKAYGDGFKVAWQGRLALSQHWFVHLSGDWLQFSAANMDQNWGLVGTWSIEHKITSSQLSIKGGVGCHF